MANAAQTLHELCMLIQASKIVGNHSHNLRQFSFCITRPELHSKIMDFFKDFEIRTLFVFTREDLQNKFGGFRISESDPPAPINFQILLISKGALFGPVPSGFASVAREKPPPCIVAICLAPALVACILGLNQHSPESPHAMGIHDGFKTGHRSSQWPQGPLWWPCWACAAPGRA